MSIIRLSGAAPPSVFRRNWGDFGRSSFIQALIDIGAVIFGVFFICATACSIPLALFLMLFCQF